MLGHINWCDGTRYSLQCIKENPKLFTPKLFDQINQEVVRVGHALVKKPNAGPIDPNALPHATKTADSTGTLQERFDSFVVETDVHFPTDMSLLYDAVRKAIEESRSLGP